MAWDEIVVVEVPGLDLSTLEPEDRKGFAQWADLPLAGAWIQEAIRLTRPEIEEQLNGQPWEKQYAGVASAWRALSNVFRALNIRWQYWPPARDIWGPFDPLESPPCQIVAGPPGFVGGITKEDWQTLLDMWEAIKGPLPVIQTLVPSDDPDELTWLEDLKQWKMKKSMQEEGGGTDPGPEPTRPLGLAPPVYANHRTLDMTPIAPAFLNYSSTATVLNTHADVVGPGIMAFSGAWTGAGCNGHEVRSDSSEWSWNCFRWYDGPGKHVILPPLRFSMHMARLLADATLKSGPKGIVMETRTRAILINIDRARRFSASTDQVDTAIFDTVKGIENSKYLKDKDMGTFNAVTSTACTVVNVVPVYGQVASVVCGLVVAAMKFLAQVIPMAVGCDEDPWGNPLPSGIDPRISLLNPPKDISVPEPKGVAVSAVTARVTDMNLRARWNAIQAPKLNMDPTKVKALLDAPPPPIKSGGGTGKPNPLTKTPSKSSGSGLALAAGIAAVVGIAMMSGDKT